MFHFFFPRALTTALFALTSVVVTAGLEAQLDSGGIEPIDSIIALVDEDVILRSELDLAIGGIVERIRASGEALPPMDLLENQVLERLIIW